MVYGILLDSARESVVISYGPTKWKRIADELQLPSKGFDIFTSYQDSVLLNISECLADILNEGTPDTYMELFGQDFFRYFIKLGYDKLFRVSGRNFRDFLFIIDQLHDSNRYTYPKMHQPLFHVTGEDETGATLEYKSVRQGYIYYAIGSLQGAAKTLFNETDVKVEILHNLSTAEYTYIVIRIQFDNKTFLSKTLFTYPAFPKISGPTFFKVFPFSILMDSSLNIHRMGHHIIKLFPEQTPLIRRPIDQVFRLIRPDIQLEWDKILSYGRHIVFLMENRLPLRVGSSGRIRLKGQMKHIDNQNMLWFLCHPVLGSTDDLMSAGLHVTDLNLFDGTGELLVASVHQMREIEETTEKQKLCSADLQEKSTELIRYKRRTQNLLNIMMPKHIATMIRSGVTAYGLCESYPLVTVLFTSIVDFKLATSSLKAAQTVGLLNGALNIFDDISDKFDVFKIRTKMDANYMIVAGLHDRADNFLDDLGTATSSAKLNDSEVGRENHSFGLNPTEIIAYLSFELLRASERLINPVTRKSFGVQIGFHAGAAIGGMIGDQNLQYCLFGDAVDTARFIMRTGEPDRVHMSRAAYIHLEKSNHFKMAYRGRTETKGRDTDATYWLTGIHDQSAKALREKASRSLQCPLNGQWS